MVLALVTVTHASREKRVDRCPLDNLNIIHGSYEIRSGTSIIVYTCDEGYIRYGSEKLYCIASSWNSLPPKCITNTCQGIPVKEPLRVEREYNGSLLRFSCAVMYKLEGTDLITCDGTIWSDIPPTCSPAAPATSCNFEEPTLCGWVHHDDTDVEWRLQMGQTKTSRTGPRHDHTFGAAGNGRYMYFETSSPTRTGHKAILLSPLYPRSYSRRCFDFWYHLLATGDVALLDVYVKPESRKIDELTPVFTVNENKGEKWINHTVLISYVSEPFQVAFVATRGASFRSDVAIDDVMLYTCPDHFPTTSTSVPTTRITPRKTTTQAPTTTKPRTTNMQTSGKTRKTSPARKTSQVTNGTIASDVRNSTKVTLAPIINPNVPVKQPKTVQEDTSSNLIYILVGVGLVIAVTVVVGVGVYCCRRQKSGYTMDSNGAVNPLYSAMASDEAAIHFAHDHDAEFI